MLCLQTTTLRCVCRTAGTERSRSSMAASGGKSATPTLTTLTPASCATSSATRTAMWARAPHGRGPGTCVWTTSTARGLRRQSWSASTTATGAPSAGPRSATTPSSAATPPVSTWTRLGAFCCVLYVNAADSLWLSPYNVQVIA